MQSHDDIEIGITANTCLIFHLEVLQTFTKVRMNDYNTVTACHSRTDSFS